MRRDLLRGIGGLAVAVCLNNFFFSVPSEAAAGVNAADEVSELDSQAESGPFDLPAGARLQPNISYGADPLQRVDVYLPAAPSKAPVIVMVHGGGWMRGNKSLWRVVKNKVTHWVGRGYIFVSVGYRLAPAADPVTQADDVAKALAFLETQITGWGGDPSRIVLMGHSSGAHLVALLTADPAISARQHVAPWRATIALDSAAMNVDQLMRRNHLGLYDHVFKADPAYWREASPTLRLTGKPVAPMLAVCSSRRMDSCPQARAFATRAVQLGGRVEVLPVDLSHPQINDFLGATSAYTEAVDAFLKTLGLP